MDEEFTKIEDYGLVGNQETCALIGKNGSLDWLALPFLDSPSVFAAILDPVRGGAFSITPALKFQSLQRYLQNTNVLVTEFTTATGEASVTDFMPPLEAGKEHRMLLRKIQAHRRDCSFRVVFRPRFDYGRQKAHVSLDGEMVVATAGEGSVVTFGAEFAAGDGEAVASLSLAEGETKWVVMMWSSDPKPPGPRKCEGILKDTVEFWRAWSQRHERSESILLELYDNLAMRSGLALKLLLNPLTGSIAAAASLALPESIGGVRNWDYRFALIRDASFTAQALFHLGYGREAAKYRKWVLTILGQLEDLSSVKPFYPLHESAQTEEGPVEGLCGYRHSGPVRVGNQASNQASHQTQLDIYGELVNTVFETMRSEEEIEPQVWEAVKRICDFVCQNWNNKDQGIWEMRTEPKDFLHSKLMCWVALDRGLGIAQNNHLDAPVAAWTSTAQEIRSAILERGFSKRLNSFVQSFGEEELDASALLIPIHRFLPADDPRVQSTIDTVWRRLSAGNGLLYRYRSEDGLSGKEGAFILCSYWLVNALALSRRTEEAEAVFRQMLVHVSPLGLLSEEVDSRDGRLIGNFPQAISHIGMINAALHLGIAKGRGYHGPPPQAEVAE